MNNSLTYSAWDKLQTIYLYFLDRGGLGLYSPSTFSSFLMTVILFSGVFGVGQATLQRIRSVSSLAKSQMYVYILAGVFPLIY